MTLRVQWSLTICGIITAACALVLAATRGITLYSASYGSQAWFIWLVIAVPKAFLDVSLSCASLGAGKGATFVLELPLAAHEAPEARCT